MVGRGRQDREEFFDQWATRGFIGETDYLSVIVDEILFGCFVPKKLRIESKIRARIFILIVLGCPRKSRGFYHNQLVARINKQGDRLANRLIHDGDVKPVFVGRRDANKNKAALCHGLDAVEIFVFVIDLGLGEEILYCSADNAAADDSNAGFIHDILNYAKNMNTRQSGKTVKIIYFITQGEMGGAQKYVFDLATHLPANEFDIAVFMGPEKQDLKIALHKKGIRTGIVKNLVRNINPARDIAAIFEIRKIIRAERPDIVHLNSTKAGFLGSLAARLAGFGNVIFTAHGFSFLEPASGFLKFFYLWAEKIARPFRKIIITVSEADRKAAIKYKLGRPENIIAIHNGIRSNSPPHEEGSGEVPSAKTTMTPSWSPPHEGEKIVIGAIANLYPTKGIKYLIEAAKIVVTKFPIAKFVIIGEGSERNNLESRIKDLSLEKNFRLLGAVSNTLEYLSQFHIFILPSVKEGFPYSILEAMAAGLPIVSTAVGGIPEMINRPLSFRHPGAPQSGAIGSRDSIGPPGLQNDTKNNGMLVPPKDPRALAQAIVYLLENPEVAKTLGRNAQEKVKTFSLEKMLRETNAVYQELLD